MLNAVSSDGNWKGVAVPSRLYDKPSPERPLAGKRLSIKDNIKLSGIATALESQSFLDTYGTDTETAPYISRLMKLGVVIVGKTKMSAFASGENPPKIGLISGVQGILEAIATNNQQGAPLGPVHRWLLMSGWISL